MQRVKLQVLPVRLDWYYCSYDVKCYMSVQHVSVGKAANYVHLACCLTIQEGIPEGVEWSTYTSHAKLQANLKLDY